MNVWVLAQQGDMDECVNVGVFASFRSLLEHLRQRGVTKVLRRDGDNRVLFRGGNFYYWAELFEVQGAVTAVIHPEST